MWPSDACLHSPEIVSGRGSAQPADVWAFGVVLYELITLQRPFRGENLAQVVSRILGDSGPEDPLDANAANAAAARPLAAAALTRVDLFHPDPDQRMTLPAFDAALAALPVDVQPMVAPAAEM